MTHAGWARAGKLDDKESLPSSETITKALPRPPLFWLPKHFWLPGAKGPPEEPPGAALPAQQYLRAIEKCCIRLRKFDARLCVNSHSLSQFTQYKPP